MHGHEASMFFKGQLLTHMAISTVNTLPTLHTDRCGADVPKGRQHTISLRSPILTFKFSLLLAVASSPRVLSVEWRLRPWLLLLLCVFSCSQTEI
jgi:hypothetical protein